MYIEFKASLLSDLLQYSDAVVLVNMSLTWHKKLSRALHGLNTSLNKNEVRCEVDSLEAIRAEEFNVGWTSNSNERK